MKAQAFHCSKCGSNSTKKCSVAYEQSISQGPNFDTQRSFGERAAPPNKPPIGVFVVSLVVGLGIASTERLIGLLVVIVSAVLLFRGKAALPRYNKDLALYSTLWICGDCGHVFQPHPNG